MSNANVNSTKGVGDWHLFTIKELKEALLTMKYRKVPDADSILKKIYKLLFYHHPD